MQARNIGRRIDAKAKRRDRLTLVCLRAVLAALGVLLIVPRSAFAGPEPAVTVTVRLYNYAQVSPAILARAEREASTILDAAGLHAVWVGCLEERASVESMELCQKGWKVEFPSIRVLSGHLTSEFHDFEFGFASIPVFATVNYEHIARRALRDDTPSELPIILGCVIAHELGHLLLRDPVHSASGIMQPQWGHDQILQALNGSLRFTTQESMLIRERALELQGR